MYSEKNILSVVKRFKTTGTTTEYRQDYSVQEEVDMHEEGGGSIEIYT